LGDEFLKHVERTKVIVHVVDVSQPRDPIEDFKTIVHELTLFRGDLLQDRQQVVVASKVDALDDPRKITRLKLMSSRRKLPFAAISSVTGQGIDELLQLLSRILFNDEVRMTIDA
jgi:GTP-binding protein